MYVILIYYIINELFIFQNLRCIKCILSYHLKQENGIPIDLRFFISKDKEIDLILKLKVVFRILAFIIKKLSYICLISGEYILTCHC